MKNLVLVPHLSAQSRYLTVATDSYSVGRLAAEHLLSLGLRHLVALPFTEHDAFTEMSAGFGQAVKEAAAALVPSPPGIHDTARCIAWTAELPTPCGVLSQRDKGAMYVIEWAGAAGRRDRA